MRRAFWAALLLGLGTASAAQAITLGDEEWDISNAGNLQLLGIVPLGNNPLNTPCIICGTLQPQQKDTGWGYNNYKQGGNISTINAFSDSSDDKGVQLNNNVIGAGYQVGDGTLFQAFLDAGGVIGETKFSIGFDVNDTGEAQTLLAFYFLNLTTHTVLASYDGGPDGTLVPSVNNGNGFPDYTIAGFDLDRDDISAGDRIIFLASMSGLNDGADSFFLQAAPSAIPIPAALPMLGGALIGMGMLARRRNRRQKKEFAVS